MEETSETKDKKPGLEVVLNGGQKEMDSATIPIQWFFSDEIIEKNPRYVLIIEQDKRETEDGNRSCNGRRYVCKVSDGVTFIPFFSPGYHRITILVFGKTDVWSEDYLKRVPALFSERDKFRPFYFRGVFFDETKDCLTCLHYPYGATTGTVIEIEIPEELFAKKPKKGLAKAVWKWTNWLYETEPINECHYRRRKMLAFTLQLPLGLVYLFCVFIYLLFKGLILVLNPLAVILLRYLKRVEEMRERKRQERSERGGKRWEKRQEKEEERRNKRAEKAMAKLRKTEALQEAERERCKKWLVNNLHITRKPERVDLGNLPKPDTTTGRMVQKFRVSYWSLIAKVCRPYGK